MFAGERGNLCGKNGRTICLCAHVTYTPTVSTKMGCFDATIYELTNIRSSQSTPITTYNGFKRSFWYELTSNIFLKEISLRLFSFCACCISSPQNMHQLAFGGYLHETRNEISFHYQKNSVYITFHCVQNEMRFCFGIGYSEM